MHYYGNIFLIINFTSFREMYTESINKALVKSVFLVGAQLGDFITITIIIHRPTTVHK